MTASKKWILSTQEDLPPPLQQSNPSLAWIEVRHHWRQYWGCQGWGQVLLWPHQNPQMTKPPKQKQLDTNQGYRRRNQRKIKRRRYTKGRRPECVKGIAAFGTVCWPNEPCTPDNGYFKNDVPTCHLYQVHNISWNGTLVEIYKKK